MTAPYDWAADPLATARPAPAEAPRPVGQLHRTVTLVPWVVARQQPKLAQLVRLDRRPGLVQIQWRRPRKFFPRN